MAQTLHASVMTTPKTRILALKDPVVIDDPQGTVTILGNDETRHIPPHSSVTLRDGDTWRLYHTGRAPYTLRGPAVIGEVSPYDPCKHAVSKACSLPNQLVIMAIAITSGLMLGMIGAMTENTLLCFGGAGLAVILTFALDLVSARVASCLYLERAIKLQTVRFRPT